MTDETNIATGQPKAKEKPLTPKYEQAFALAKELNIPPYEDKGKLRRELNKAGYFWEKDAEAWQKQEPEPTPAQPPELDRDDDSVILQNDAGGIWFRGRDNNYCVANFGLAVRHCITDTKDRVLWNVDVLHDRDQTTNITITHDDFATVARFHAALLKHCFVFRGQQREFNLLKEALLPTVQVVEKVERLGYHAASKSFVFANGVLNHDFHAPDEFGIVNCEKHALFLPCANKLHLQQYADYARFCYTDSKWSMDGIANLIYQAYGREGLIPLCYNIAALFRDIAFEQLRFFPLLVQYGKNSNTGKSSLARLLTSTYGREQGIISLRSPNSLKSIPRVFDQAINSVVWLDEFPQNPSEATLGILQAAYEGSGYIRANMDHENNTTRLTCFSGVVVTTNHLPMDPILLSRWLINQMPGQRHTPEQQKAFYKLRKISTEGLSSVTGKLLWSSEKIRETWLSRYDSTLKALQTTVKNKPETEINERLIENMAVCLTPALILEDLGKLHLSKYFKLDAAHTLLGVGYDFLKAQMPLMQGQSPLGAFFELLSMRRDKGKISDWRDYKIYTERKHGKKVLALRMKQIALAYMEQHWESYRKTGLTRVELEALLETHPAYLGRLPVGFYRHGDENSGDETTIKNTPIFDFDLIKDEFGEVF